MVQFFNPEFSCPGFSANLYLISLCLFENIQLNHLGGVILYSSPTVTDIQIHIYSCGFFQCQTKDVSIDNHGGVAYLKNADSIEFHSSCFYNTSSGNSPGIYYELIRNVSFIDLFFYKTQSLVDGPGIYWACIASSIEFKAGIIQQYFSLNFTDLQQPTFNDQSSERALCIHSLSDTDVTLTFVNALILPLCVGFTFKSPNFVHLYVKNANFISIAPKAIILLQQSDNSAEDSIILCNVFSDSDKIFISASTILPIESFNGFLKEPAIFGVFSTLYIFCHPSFGVGIQEIIPTNCIIQETEFSYSSVSDLTNLLLILIIVGVALFVILVSFLIYLIYKKSNPVFDQSEEESFETSSIESIISEDNEGVFPIPNHHNENNFNLNPSSNGIESLSESDDSERNRLFPELDPDNIGKSKAAPPWVEYSDQSLGGGISIDAVD